MGDLYKDTGTYTPDKLIAGVSIPITAKGIRIAKGEGSLKRGTLLGIAADGTYKRTDTEEMIKNEEGEDAVSQTAAIGADCILADDVDSTDTDVVATAYVTGGFNADAIILPEGKSVRDHENTLRQLGIFLHAVQEY
ncbi:head decoration protein [bacterium D16-50]|nr:head decoration protein [bacterium D16-50]